MSHRSTPEHVAEESENHRPEAHDPEIEPSCVLPFDAYAEAAALACDMHASLKVTVKVEHSL